VEEICLKMTKDPSEVEAIIGSLIKKGYLDKDLKPKKPEAKISREALEGVTSRPAWKEPAVSAKEIPKTWPSEEELIEMLLASKMREELKRKLKKKSSESPAAQNSNTLEG
jgi:hypothetical protein